MALLQAPPPSVSDSSLDCSFQQHQCWARLQPPQPSAGPCCPPRAPLPRGEPSSSEAGGMGSVSSLISGRSSQERSCRGAGEVSAAPKTRRPSPATSCFRAQDSSTLRSGSSLEHLLVLSNKQNLHNHNQHQNQLQKQNQNQHQLNAPVLPPPLPTKKHPRLGGVGGGVGLGDAHGANGSCNQGLEEVVVVGDWNHNLLLVPRTPCGDSEETRDSRTLNGNIGGPPPKLIPVSGQLEKVSPP